MKKKLDFVSVRLRHETKLALEKLARETDRTVSQHGKYAIEEYLQRKDGKQ